MLLIPREFNSGSRVGHGLVGGEVKSCETPLLINTPFTKRLPQPSMPADQEHPSPGAMVGDELPSPPL